MDETLKAEKMSNAHDRMLRNLGVARRLRVGEMSEPESWFWSSGMRAHQLWLEVREDVEILSEGFGRSEGDQR